MMHETTTLKDKLTLFSRLLIPILITQVSMYLMNFFDTVMSGRVSAEDLAGVAIGSSIWVPVFTGINGVLLAITPIIAQLLGAKASNIMTKKIQQGIYLAIVLAITVFVTGIFVLNPLIQLMDLDAPVAHTAKYYLVFLGFGIIPLFVFNTLRAFIDALGQTRISMIIILTSLPINFALNYIFIFGKLGVPAFGGIGSGIATAITYWLVCGIAIVIVMKNSPFRLYNTFSNWSLPAISDWWEQLKIGVPMGFAIFFETSIFSAVTLLMSVYNTETIAAHQAAMNFSTLLYMLPLSVAMALTIAVGFEVGAKRFEDARTYGFLGLISGVGISIFAGIVLFIGNDAIASLYNSEPDVITLTKKFIYFAIFFQLADAFGAPLQGALRGYKDVNITLIISLISYWGIGLPSGWLIANYTALEAFGYWVGLILGLSCGAIALLLRLLYLQKNMDMANTVVKQQTIS